MKLVKDYLNKFEPNENRYACGTDRWYISTLKEGYEGCELFDYDLGSININLFPWDFKNWSFESFLYHMRRMENVDMDEPIILTPWGAIADGYHRLARAIMEGKRTVKAYRLNVMPQPDETKEEE